MRVQRPIIRLIHGLSVPVTIAITTVYLVMLFFSTNISLGLTGFATRDAILGWAILVGFLLAYQGYNSSGKDGEIRFYATVAFLSFVAVVFPLGYVYRGVVLNPLSPYLLQLTPYWNIVVQYAAPYMDIIVHYFERGVVSITGMVK